MPRQKSEGWLPRQEQRLVTCRKETQARTWIRPGLEDLPELANLVYMIRQLRLKGFFDVSKLKCQREPHLVLGFPILLHQTHTKTHLPRL